MRVAIGVSAAAVLLLTAVACGGSTASTASSKGDPQPTAPTSTAPTPGSVPCPIVSSAAPAADVHGHIRVLAAASLKAAFTDLAQRFEAAHAGSHVEVSFGASSDLAAQIQNAAPADVFASADTKNMDKVVKTGDVEAPAVFTCNQLEIAVGKGNPKKIRALGDLGQSGVTFVLCAPAVPCGNFGRQILERAGVKAQPIGSESDVKAVVAKVGLGEADAGLVYVTDVTAAKGKIGGVEIPAEQNVLAEYPIAVVKASKEEATAEAFDNFVRSADGQKVLASYGFNAS